MWIDRTPRSSPRGFAIAKRFGAASSVGVALLALQGSARCLMTAAVGWVGGGADAHRNQAADIGALGYAVLGRCAPTFCILKHAARLFCLLLCADQNLA
jgi:hypothetical protein